MNKNKIILSFLMLFLSFNVFAQNNDDVYALGLPGDNLNLYAVLDEFQKSPTLKQFEQAINDRTKNINNLDLNNDNQVDYISVNSYQAGQDYSIVLRVAINASQKQDVAVIEVNKVNNNNVMIQLIGNEDLYGKDYIIEPGDNNTNGMTANPGYTQNNNSYYYNTPYYVNNWPVIVYLFSPRFVNYYSPWYWGYYPRYWNPWAPMYYSNYWSFNSHYYHSRFYYRCNRLRHPIHPIYYNHNRRRSNIVTQNKKRGTYNSTYRGQTYRKPAEQIRNVSPVRSTPVKSNDRIQNIPRTNSNEIERNDNVPTRENKRQVAPTTTPRETPTRRVEPATRETRPVTTPKETPTRRMEPETRETRPVTTPRVTPTRRVEPATRETPTKHVAPPVRETRQAVTPRVTPSRRVESVPRQTIPASTPKASQSKSLNRR